MAFMRKRCYNGGEKHKFKPRYDKINNGRIFEIKCVPNINDIKELSTDTIYVKDVCVWCGKEIKR